MTILQNNNTSYPPLPKASQATVFLIIFTVPSMHSFLFEWPSNQIKFFFKKAASYYTNCCTVTVINYHDKRQPKKEFAFACDSAGLDVPNGDESMEAVVGT